MRPILSLAQAHKPRFVYVSDSEWIEGYLLLVEKGITWSGGLTGRLVPVEDVLQVVQFLQKINAVVVTGSDFTFAFFLPSR